MSKHNHQSREEQIIKRLNEVVRLKKDDIPNQIGESLVSDDISQKAVGDENTI